MGEASATVTPQAVTAMLAQQRETFDGLRRQDDQKAVFARAAAVQEAKLETAAVMRRAAAQTHAEGGFAPVMLVNDPYRDTRATLAEARTNSFALKLTFDAVDHTYDVEGAVKGRYTTRRISRHFDDLTEARDFFTNAASRFFRVHPFRTLVDF